MNISKMVPLVSFLAALRILTEAQICNNGEGKIVYEKSSSLLPESNVFTPATTAVSNVTSHEIISKTSIPFKVLEECFRRCQEDRVTKITKCSKFDFLPGKRLSQFESNLSGTKGGSDSRLEYEPSMCILYSESTDHVNLEQLSQNHGSAWNFNEVCLKAQHLTQNCPNRLYVFGKVPSRKLISHGSLELELATKEECENRCLTEPQFICRSASFNSKAGKCYLSQANRYVSPGDFQVDSNFEYLENLCLKHEELCKWSVLIVENGKQLDPSFEKFWTTVTSISDCSKTCLSSLDRYGFLCRSFAFNEEDHSCILYDEDPLDPNTSGSDTRLKWIPSKGNLYRVLCSPDSKAEQVDGQQDNKTLECYRHKRLRGRHQMELSVSTFYECLSTCMKQFVSKCRSIEYSHSKQVCRFSGHTVMGPASKQDTDDVLIDDDTFDYYQFMWNDELANVHQPDHYAPDRLLDRHDSIEVSHSQPGVYGNFILPVQPPRDHHRGGFAYSQVKSPVNVPTTSVITSRPPIADYRPPSNYNPAFGSNHFMPRTPSGNRFMSYGVPPYAQQNQVVQSNYPVLPSSVPSAATYDRHQQTYHLPATPVGENSIQSPGCKFESNSVLETTKFRRVGFGARLKSKHVYKVVRADKLEDCERFCLETKDFVCKSFNFRAFFPDNCELSSVDTRKFKLENSDHFEHNTQFDYYERIERKALMAPNSMDCFEVLQTCSPDGMELKLKTAEGFVGRIYTYGFYDSCFFDGNGGTTSVLRISKPNGFPRCGTQQVGDAMTNIVVVQFNDYVQTSRDKKYNLTCFISGPGEAVVTSNYMDTKTDGRHPMQIEHLPAQNILTSNIVLRVLYRGTPTNTIVVGDLLTFRLEARNQYRFNGYHNDIFATNVIAKDPYTGRQVLLIDSRGCPVDLFVFPELHKTPDGALEAEFYAFKIPDSNFLVFQATVKTCKGPCEPVICTDRGRGQGSFPSWGRRRRRSIRNNPYKSGLRRKNGTRSTEEEEVHELFRVYLSHEEVPEPEKIERANPEVSKYCVDKFVYFTMVLMSAFFVIVFILILPYCGLVRLMKLKYKSKAANSMNQWEIKWPMQVPISSPMATSGYYVNDPIYADPSTILERSRSLQSLTIQDANRLF